MRAVDTNLLVRLIARDDPAQISSAEEFVARGAWVSHVVLAETTWVLESVYRRPPRAIADAVHMLLHHAQLVVQDTEVAAAALATFRRHPSVGFSDCLIVELARQHGHIPLGTFDRSLGRLEGAQRL